ncbi:hypothetical protein [Streptomyces abikoensis]
MRQSVQVGAERPVKGRVKGGSEVTKVPAKGPGLELDGPLHLRHYAHQAWEEPLLPTPNVPAVEDSVASSWLAQAAVDPRAAPSVWAMNPTQPRRLLCGVLFDVVLCRQPLAEIAYRFLDLYEQPVGPAVVIPALITAAVFVPAGTEDRWPVLMESAQWPPSAPRPTCLGRQHAIRVPPLSRASASAAQWLEPPEVEEGFPPYLTGPVQLARCLVEARELLSQARSEHPHLPTSAKRARP